MSSLWTPDGERNVPRQKRPKRDPAAPDPREQPMVDPEAMASYVEEMRRELADAPAEVVVANHCYGLFELAAVYLSQDEPRLPQASLAIDALGAVVDSLGDRLGDQAASLREGLSQLRLAFVQIDGARRAAEAAGSDSTPNGAGANGADHEV